jgi:hypothetical protein
MLIDLRTQYFDGDFDCQNPNSLPEYIALGRSSGVNWERSEAIQGT